jgi:hypothetical protein
MSRVPLLFGTMTIGEEGKGAVRNSDLAEVFIAVCVTVI